MNDNRPTLKEILDHDAKILDREKIIKDAYDEFILIHKIIPPKYVAYNYHIQITIATLVINNVAITNEEYDDFIKAITLRKKKSCLMNNSDMLLSVCKLKYPTDAQINKLCCVFDGCNNKIHTCNTQ